MKTQTKHTLNDNILKYNKPKKIWASYGFICSCCGDVWNIKEIHDCEKYNTLIENYSRE